jgi:hypothetical protein
MVQSFFKKIKRAATAFAIRHIFKYIPDKLYLEIRYYLRVKTKLNLKNPVTFGDKINWLKLYDRNPLYTQLADKYAVRKYVAKKIGEEYLLPLLGVWDSADAIDYSKLPNQFVLKCTHDYGSIEIIKDKKTSNLHAVNHRLEWKLKRDFYVINREWAYKNIPPRIVAEPYIEDNAGQLDDYKCFCFDGKVRLISVDYDRFHGHKKNLYTPDWQYIPAVYSYPTDPEHVIPAPKALKKMIALAEKLSEGIPHVRADFYLLGERIIFGELTFYTAAGFYKFQPESFGKTMGNYINLPTIN